MINFSNRLHSIGLVIGTATLSACQTSPVTGQHPPSLAEVNAVTQGILVTFFDPSSVQFLNSINTGETTLDGNPVKVLCIMANAKNRMVHIPAFS